MHWHGQAFAWHVSVHLEPSVKCIITVCFSCDVAIAWCGDGVLEVAHKSLQVSYFCPSVAVFRTQQTVRDVGIESRNNERSVFFLPAFLNNKLNTFKKIRH